MLRSRLWSRDATSHHWPAIAWALCGCLGHAMSAGPHALVCLLGSRNQHLLCLLCTTLPSLAAIHTTLVISSSLAQLPRPRARCHARRQSNPPQGVAGADAHSQENGKPPIVQASLPLGRPSLSWSCTKA